MSKETLNKSSPRRRPGSSLLIFLDSGIRRNDGQGLVQNFPISRIVNEHCLSCVFHPPKLPAHAYPEDDYRMLQEMSCSFDFQPRDENCHSTRKTSCSLVDLENLKQTR